MERASGALHAGLRTTAHSSASVPFSPSTLLARSVRDQAPPARAGGRTRSLRRAPPYVPAKLPLAERFRSCYCLKEKGYLMMHKALQNSSLRVFSSHGQQEADLNTEDIRKDKFLIDCGVDQECVLGGIVALGKFDALHIGHRELAIEASKVGIPFLLSFVGIAEVLGWESRPPIVAKCDRKRVLSTWAPYCGNVVPLEYQVEFSNVRHLTPRQFVERLSKDLRVSGVVAGENYRFGYKASGDVSELVKLCKEYGLSAFIVSSVMDKTQRSYNGASKSINSSDRGQVSSTRVRHALAMGDMEYVTELLGRKHRLVLMLNERCLIKSKRIVIPKSFMLNQPPENGAYERCTLLVDDLFIGPCRVVIDPENIDIELDSVTFTAQDLIPDGRPISIEFGW